MNNYRIKRLWHWYEPQMQYTAGISGQKFWVGLTDTGYWCDPDSFKDGDVRVRSLFRDKETAKRAVLRAKAMNGESMRVTVKP